MSQSEQNLAINLEQQIEIKKYKKIRLKGLAIPISSKITPSFHHKHSPKQQSIQKSSSSSQQQTFYENYFQNSLEEVIEQLIGNKIEYQIDQLKQSDVYGYANNSDVEFVDVVIKVQLHLSNQGSFYERIKQIKQKQFQKRSKNQVSKLSKQKNAKPLQAFIKQKQDKQRYYEQEQGQISYDDEQQIQSEVRLQRDNSMTINQTSQQIIDINNNSSINLSSNKSQTKAKNQSKPLQNKKQKYNKVQQQQLNQTGQKSPPLSQQVKSGSRKKLFLVFGTIIGIFLVFLGLRLFYFVQKTNTNVNIPKAFIIDEQNRRFFNGELYRGNLEQKFQKANFIVPFVKQDQYLKLPLYVQTLPPVNYPSQSLHPKKIPYRRPTTTKLYTYPDIFKREIGKIQPNHLNFTYQEEQIIRYLTTLKNQNKFPFPESLYRAIQNQPKKQLLLQAQYIYLQSKYNISDIERLTQKSLCIVSIGRNMFKSNKFVPFFSSLLSQNYSNYRLIYIDNGSDDEYQLIRVMNYLSDKFYDEIGMIGSHNLYFLRNERLISQSLAKDAAIKEFCAQGDIVIDIDENSLFLGRQSLRVINVIYDNSRNRKMIEESKKLMKKDSEDKKRFIKSKQNMPQPQSTTPLPSIWMAYSNYLYSGKQQRDIKIIFANSSEQINQRYQFQNMMKNSSSSLKQLSKELIFDICLKTYVLELETKLNIDKLVFQVQPPSQYSQISDTYIFTSLLQFAGKFDNTSITHVISIDQPFCFKNSQNSDKCEQAKKKLKEIKSFAMNRYSQLPTISDNANKIQNKVKNSQQFISALELVRKQIEVECLNQPNK